MKILQISVYSLILLLAGCGNRALFDELATNRIKVVLKGTYESNNPRNWTGNFPSDTDSIDDDTDHDNSTSEPFPTKLMLDVAELKIVDITGRHVQDFANYRMPYLFWLGDEADPFFNGNGVLYQNDDVRPDFRWDFIYLYLRKMIFDSAKKYHLDDNGDSFDGAGSWIDDGEPETIFHEVNVYGFDVNPVQVLSYYDSLRIEAYSINRIFPVVVPILDGFVFDNDERETVLEIRIVLKNFIKKYEYDYSDDIAKYVYHFYGPSDWLRNVNADETVFGGNVLAVARSYVPGKTATITVNVPAINKYVIAFSSDYSIDDFIPGSRVRPDPCDEPKKPDTPVPNDFESLLDYFLKYEKYKEAYNTFVNCIIDEATHEASYANPWIDYNERLNEFKLPPLATWCGTTTCALTNIPVEKAYYVYYADAPVPEQNLPESFNTCNGGSPIYIIQDETVSCP